MSAPLQDDEWQWLTHPSIAPLSQRFHIGAVGFWTARGWEPCAPPAEFDPVTAEQLQAEQQATAGQSQPGMEPPPVAPESTSKAKKSAPPAPEGSE